MTYSFFNNLYRLGFVIITFLLMLRVLLFGREFQVGLYSSVVLVGILSFSVIYIIANKAKYKLNLILFFFSCYLLFQLLSVFFYFFNHNSYSYNIDFYSALKLLSFIILPQVTFVLAGSILGGNGLIFFRRLTTLLLFISIFFFIFKPFNYQSYLTSIYGAGDSYLEHLRLIGVFDTSMTMGSVSLVMIIFYSYSKPDSFKPYEYFLILIPIIAVAMSLQRSSIGLAAVVLLSTFFMKLRKPKELFILFTGLIVSFIILLTYMDNWLFKLFKRMGELSSGFERFDAIDQIYSVSDSLLIGLGVGLSSHKGQFISEINFFDSNYFRVLADLGILGFLFFIFLLLSIGIGTIINKRLEFWVLTVFVIQAIFTNVFDLFFSSFIFWYILGTLIPSTYKLTRG